MILFMQQAKGTHRAAKTPSDILIMSPPGEFARKKQKKEAKLLEAAEKRVGEFRGKELRKKTEKAMHVLHLCPAVFELSLTVDLATRQVRRIRGFPSERRGEVGPHSRAVGELAGDASDSG